MNRLATVKSILELARAERSSPTEAALLVGEVRERLEQSLGGTVRPSEAARTLGISPPSLKRWLDSGDIATVLSREGRREIPIPELVDLALESEELRRKGRERVVSGVIRHRREQASNLDVDSLLPPRRPRTHRQAELQSLAYHRLVAQRLTPKMVAEARRKLDRWESEGQLHPRWASEWRGLLDRPLPEIRRAISSQSTRASELRQTSPFSGSLSEHERQRIIEEVETRR